MLNAKQRSRMAARRCSHKNHFTTTPRRQLSRVKHLPLLRLLVTPLHHRPVVFDGATGKWSEKTTKKQQVQKRQQVQNQR
jgi:hypothetical protein